MGDTPRSQTVSTILQRIAQQARDYPDRAFTTLAHHIDVEFLREAYARTRKDSAAGVDGVTAQQYAEHLEANLTDLHQRLRSGHYVAPPVRRIYLEKEDGTKRPIGIPALEDKIAQRAVAMLLSAIYEQKFRSCSYGFREGRSAHQALHAVREQCMERRIGWIVDADVSAFFDSLERSVLREVLSKRVADGAIMRLIGKWLKAGVLEGGELFHPERGTPQGGVVSPILANIVLDEVLDGWFEREVVPRMRGEVFLVRFADDFVIGCEVEEDARRILSVLPKRFERYGLRIHPEKTKLVRFQKPSRSGGEGGPGTFEFLGLTHHWERSRRGYWVIKRRTAAKRVRRTLRRLWQWCRDHRHDPVQEQYESLKRKLQGHYHYYGIRGNQRMLEVVLKGARRAWQYWLNRRGQKGNRTWEQFDKLTRVLPLPRPRIVHNI